MSPAGLVIASQLGAGRTLRLVSRPTTDSTAGDSFSMTLGDVGTTVVTAAGIIPLNVAMEHNRLAAKFPHLSDEELQRVEQLITSYPGAVAALRAAGEAVH